MTESQGDGWTKCPDCGAELPSGARFCMACGRPQAESAPLPSAPLPTEPTGEDPVKRIAMSQPVAGARYLDPSLGDSLEFGPSLRTLVAAFGLGFLMILIGSTPSVKNVLWAIPCGLVGCLIGLWAVQTSLVVGTEGFRYSRPLGSTEIRWDQVSKVRARQSDWTRDRWIRATLVDGSPFEFGLLGLSDSRDNISDLMDDCHAAWRQANPTESTAEDSLVLRPAVVVTDPGVRRPLAFGLSALALIAVVLAGTVWRAGAFDGFLRGAPAAPKQGHWEGSDAALSFDIRPDGQMANVSLTIDDLPYASCTVLAATISVAPDHTFTSLLRSDPANLLVSQVEVTGTFYGSTASGTYKASQCGGLLRGDQEQDDKWSAEWTTP